ncbi:beta-glucoside-specific PTS transporter subunit IIABC [Enterococcus sp. RIT-PI-f]|uniref:beta-glucoside-specific PTS transporter subunit IIABC n=1 Tax=Enterococcus sp. RIT-PI-f TaxID=1690244 RepID=UPI0006B9D086|nr:beta-glucoside-specific PTS transporter subunit IIABC [Enterococcus sp. RIT-PI-f]KPG70040.1 PTS sugar transporter subunit IIAB [Enterococcus sp. RIT-PI-f]
MDYKQLANDIYEKVGGDKNIQHVTHCATRLRFTLADDKKADSEGIKQLKGVTGLVQGNGQYQVIIGPDVSSVYAQLPVTENGAEESSNDNSVISRLLDFIAGCFTPMIAIIAAGGMLQVVLSLLELSGILAATDDTYLVLYQVSQAAFFFIPIYLGNSVAKRLKIDPFLGSYVGGIFVMPGLTTLLSQEGGITLFGLTVPNVSYNASVLPVLLTVWLMSYVYRFADRILPNSVKFILRPLIAIIVITPFALLLIGPLGVTIGNYVSQFLNYLTNNFGPLAVLFMGAFAQLLVMTGMHTTLTPILLTSLATYGYDDLIVPGMLLGLAAEAAICLAAGIKANDAEFKQVSFSSAITALMGVSEPALYGVTLRLKKPIVGMILGGAVGGLYFGLMKINTPVVIASFVALPSYSNVLHATIGSLITFAIAFAYTWFVVKDSDFPNNNVATVTETADVEAPAATETTEEQTVVEKIVLAPLQGMVITLAETNDQAFASLALGKGAAVKPQDDTIAAPFSGKVSAVFPGNHAIGITSDSGIELLIHIGIDTVNMQGDGFTRQVNDGDTFSAGQALLHFDSAKIAAAGYEDTVMITVTNTMNFLDVVALAAHQEVQAGEQLLAVF